MGVTLELLIDTDGDGSYSHNVGGNLRLVDWGRGRNDRVGIADVGWMNAIVSSPNGEYFLQGPNRISGIAPGKRVKLQAVADVQGSGGTPTSQRVQLFKGFLQDSVPQAGFGVGGARRAQLLATDSATLLQDSDISVPVIRGYSLAQLVHDILNRAGWQGEREVNFGGAVPVATVAGIETRSAFDALAEVCDATGGIFFIDGSGKAVFRGHQVRQFAPTSDVSDIVESYAQAAPDVVTEVHIMVNPSADVGPVEIWSMGEFLLKAKRANGKWFAYHTDQNVTHVVPPVQGLDYRAKIDDHKAPKGPQGDRHDEWLHIEVYPRGPHDGSLFVWSDGGPKNRRVRVILLRLRGVVFQALDPIPLVFR